MITILAGDFGTGKTTFLKKHFLKTSREKKIYALIRADFPMYKCETDFVKYVSEATRKANTLFVVDEAKTAIPKEEPLNPKNKFERDLLVWFLNARKCNNFIFIVFHTLRDIPIWLVSYTDVILRFRTNDLMQHQLSRFQSFPSVVESIKQFPTLPNFDCDEIKLR